MSSNRAALRGKTTSRGSYTATHYNKSGGCGGSGYSKMKMDTILPPRRQNKRILPPPLQCVHKPLLSCGKKCYGYRGHCIWV